MKRLTQFLHLTAVEFACKRMRADLLVQLIDEDGLRAIDIARATGLRQSDLSQMYATAKMFPAGGRPDGVPYNLLLLATRIIRKFPALEMRPNRALGEIRRTGLSQHRDVCRHFAQMNRLAELRRALPTGVPDGGDSVIDAVHHGRFQGLLHRVPRGAAKVISVDPPYVYPQTAHRGYRSISARSQRCDSESYDAATALVFDVLRDWQPKLGPGGVLLLWQASGPLQREIMGASEQFGWELTGPIIWDKLRVQPGDLGTPYSRQTEMLWVFSRPGDALLNHDGSSRSDVLRFAPVSFPSVAHEQNHCFEKPVELCEFLVRKHSHAGELVLDLCGCTGSMSLAAIETGRHWMYVESNLENYRLGAERISKRLARQAARAS